MDKKKSLWNDVLIVLAMAANFGAMMSTRIVTSTISAYCTTANVLETNPVQRALLSLQPLQLLVEMAFFGSMLAIYLSIRRATFGKGKEDEKSRLILNFFTFAIFLALTYDFLNDAGILIGLFLH